LTIVDKSFICVEDMQEERNEGPWHFALHTAIGFARKEGESSALTLSAIELGDSRK
jgi:hypothetical protein